MYRVFVNRCGYPRQCHLAQNKTFWTLAHSLSLAPPFPESCTAAAAARWSSCNDWKKNNWWRSFLIDSLRCFKYSFQVLQRINLNQRNVFFLAIHLGLCPYKAAMFPRPRGGNSQGVLGLLLDSRPKPNFRIELSSLESLLLLLALSETSGATYKLTEPN